MTPQQQAEAIVEKYFLITGYKESAIMCAIEEVKAILSYHIGLFNKGLKDVHQVMNSPKHIYNDVMNPSEKYLQQILEHLKQM